MPRAIRADPAALEADLGWGREVRTGRRKNTSVLLLGSRTRGGSASFTVVQEPVSVDPVLLVEGRRLQGMLDPRGMGRGGHLQPVKCHGEVGARREVGGAAGGLDEAGREEGGGKARGR